MKRRDENINRENFDSEYGSRRDTNKNKSQLKVGLIPFEMAVATTDKRQASSHPGTRSICLKSVSIKINAASYK